ncbi:hypothetical protein B296_00003889 [Ensete ventricosum]|uniref:Uncharacterized protein n=1 Tax=Ensete ventricosum TaxID=4639 RepID=A0A427AQG2_ENSVE|nr:hypothetical protein B296_00003889 [Ensete ventricosum]
MKPPPLLQTATVSHQVLYCSSVANVVLLQGSKDSGPALRQRQCRCPKLSLNLVGTCRCYRWLCQQPSIAEPMIPTSTTVALAVPCHSLAIFYRCRCVLFSLSNDSKSDILSAPLVVRKSSSASCCICSLEE